MATQVPASFKILVSAIRRADELDKSSMREERVVAYYCRMHSVLGATKISKAPNAEEMKFITDQMTKLESLKPSLNLGSKEDSARICKEYADTVFRKADDVDRAGLADKSIVKVFYSAGTFYDILEQFGELDKETVEKKKYAKWKATDILNAINNGLQPSAGGYGESADGSESHAEDLSPAPTSAPVYHPAPAPIYSPAVAAADHAAAALHIPNPPGRAASTASSGVIYQPMPSTAQSAPHTPPPMTVQPAYKPASNFQPPRGAPINNADPRVKDSVELINFALTSIKHNDLAVARERLQEALRRLG